MKYIILVSGIFLAISISQASFANQGPQFFSALYDIPVMPGLTENPEETLIFDKPSGRFVQSTALTESRSEAEIITFYSDSLPQLGWQKISQNQFKRAGERLRIEFERQNSHGFVFFTLMPEK